MKKTVTKEPQAPEEEFVATLVIRMRNDSSCSCSFPKGMPSNVCRAMLEAAHEVLTIEAVKNDALQQRILMPHGIKVPHIVQ